MRGWREERRSLFKCRKLINRCIWNFDACIFKQVFQHIDFLIKMLNNCKKVAFSKTKCYDIVKRDFQISNQVKPKQKVSSTSHLQTIVCVSQKFKLIMYSIYDKAMLRGQFEYACCEAVILFLIIFVATRIQFFFEKKLVHY